jgi:caffeoyl-CoA O-methyltransferase
MKDSLDAILRRPQAEYLDSLLSPRDPLLAEMEQYAAAHGEPIADPEVVQLMKILVHARQPKRLLELGTNIGYSVIALGRELGREAVFETIEIDEATLSTAHQFIERASLRCQIELHHGAALEVLDALSGPWDFVFIDCVKTEYPDYLRTLLPKLRRGALIVADNVLWKGQVAEGARNPSQEASTAALREFNSLIMHEPRLQSVIIPTGDGVSISIVQ